MKFDQLLIDVEEEFGKAIAANVVAIVAIQLSLKPKKTDFEPGKTFTHRIRKKSRDLLWNVGDGTYDLSFDIAMAYHEFDSRREMQGMGGCTPITLRAILERQDLARPMERKHEI